MCYSPWGCKEPDMTGQLNNYTHTHTHTHTYMCVCMYIHMYIGCFYVLAIVSSAAMNIGVHISFQMRVFVSFLDICTGVRLLDYMGSQL